MTDLVIRDLDPAVEAHLREQAARNGASVEDEIKALLTRLPGEPEEGLGTSITRLFTGSALRPGEELQRPGWTWTPPTFDK